MRSSARTVFSILTLLAFPSLLIAQVTNQNGPFQGMFHYALIARGTIDLQGSNIMTDSFNSSDPAHSTNGMYPAGNTAMLLSGGDVATDAGIVNAINIGNAKIHGRVNTGPNGTVAMGLYGAIGDYAWQASQSGAEPGYVGANENFTFPSVRLPYTTGLSPTAGPITVSTTNYIFAGNTNITSSTYPDPVPSSGVQSNVTYSTVSSLPSPIPDGLVTNVFTNLNHSTTIPQPGTYIGTYNISSVPTNTISAPAPGTYVGDLITSTTNVTSTSYPAAGTYVGSVGTNTTTQTTTSLPAAGSYIGNVTTNTASQTTSFYPIPGSFLGSVDTNTTSQTTSSYPSPGSYLGGVTTNTTTQTNSTYPAPGTYLGLVTTNTPTGGGSGNGGHGGTGNVTYTYDLITGYTYAAIIGYTYDQITGFTFDAISGYTYALITGYSYNLVVDCSYKTIGTNYIYPTYTYTYSYATYTTNITAGSYDYVFQGGPVTAPPVRYYVDSISSGNILVQGNVQLVVAGNFSLGGTGSKNALTIASDGRLEMYVGGPTLSLSGNGVVNQTGYAQNFLCWGTDAVTSMTLNGNGQFIGIVVAPNANVTLKSGGASNTDFIGSLVVNSATITGNYAFHFDESLLSRGSSRALTVADIKVTPGMPISLPVTLAAAGGENAVGFSVSFDSSQLTLVDVTPGSGVQNSSFYANTDQASQGKSGITVALTTGASWGAGVQEVAVLHFIAGPSAVGTLPVNLTDDVVQREVADAGAQSLSTVYVNGSATIALPPLLSTLITASNVTLIWPAQYSNYMPQSVTDTGLAIWSSTPGTPLMVGTNLQLTLPLTNQQQFFRLSR
jgi:hypothetical protein